MLSSMNAPQVLLQTAHHEAGHAVACLLRGEGEVDAVSLSGDRHGEGLTSGRMKPADEAFISYAGPWAEGRYLWTQDSAADEDLDDYVTGCLLDQPADATPVLDFERNLVGQRELVAATYQVWDMELAREWDWIERIAAALLAAPGRQLSGGCIEDLRQ